MSECRSPHKVRHSSQAAANEHMLSLRKNGGRDLNVYPCGGHFHVGHSQAKLRGRIQRALRRS